VKGTFSCELFPPKSEKGMSALAAAVDELALLKPAFFSCTCGAGGSSQEGTHDIVKMIVDKGLPAAPHLTCIGSTPAGIRESLEDYRSMGITRIVALRGDLPEGEVEVGHFHYANELVEFIRRESGALFHLDVAAYPEKHPEAASLQEDFANFRKKVDAGADSALTQYFFNADAYFRFREDCLQEEIAIPIVPGILPITNYRQLARFSETCGAEIPRWIRTRLEGYGEDLESIRAFGAEVTTRLCENLLAGGAPGLHFYTLNRAEPTAAIWKNLGI
jgi:methylenetetrahydrofolate reductase (NADPH)